MCQKAVTCLWPTELTPVTGYRCVYRRRTERRHVCRATNYGSQGRRMSERHGEQRAHQPREPMTVFFPRVSYLTGSEKCARLNHDQPMKCLKIRRQRGLRLSNALFL